MKLNRIKLYKIKQFQLINTKLNINIDKIIMLRLITIFMMLFKTEIILISIQNRSLTTILKTDYKELLIHLSFILLVYSFGYLMYNKKQIKYYFFINVIYSIILLGDIWCFRLNRDFLGLKNIFYPGTFNISGKSFFALGKIEVIFFIDIIFLFYYIFIKKLNSNHKKNNIKFLVSSIFSVIVIISSYIIYDVKQLEGDDNKLFEVSYYFDKTVKKPGALGYHFFESYNTLSKVLHKPNKHEMNQINEWVENNKECLENNEYKGILKGKNVIFIQLESFEDFIINKKTNNKYITPYLNKIIQEGFYFNNIYEQNNAGNSIDCDFMINTSTLPLGKHITGLNHGDLCFKQSLPRLLKSEGYMTVATHGEQIGDFNWTELYKNSFGSDKIWDLSQYKMDEKVGFGISDRIFLSQLADKIKTLPQPFYVHAPTLSCHGPFILDQKYRKLNLPKEIDGSYLGGYLESARYTDEQVEMFVHKLEQLEIMNNTVIVLFGDHTGVHKYHNQYIKDLNFEDGWWKENYNKIPFVVYSKGLNSKVFEAVGGQIDIYPTIAYLLGIDDSKYRNRVMGRVLVNTNRNSTVIKGNVIKGQVKDEKEKQHLLKAYDIGEKIINNRYFEK